MRAAVRTILGLATVAIFAGTAHAATITTLIAGNDCGSPTCVANETGTYSNTAGQTGSPFVIQFNGDGSVALINTTLFPTITGAEFDFTPDLNGSLGSGSWTYTPGPGDPVIRFWTAKAGPNYNLFYDNGPDDVGPAVGVTSGYWATPINPSNDRPYGISHMSFYDTAAPPAQLVPEPSMMLLFGAAAATGLRARLRRK